MSDLKIGKHESSSRIADSLAESGDGEGLAGGSSNQKVDWFMFPAFVLGKVAEVGDVGQGGEQVGDQPQLLGRIDLALRLRQLQGTEAGALQAGIHRQAMVDAQLHKQLHAGDAAPRGPCGCLDHGLSENHNGLADYAITPSRLAT